MDKMKIWLASMKAGEVYGCHQIANRSFFIKGWQFPVCARCCGVIIGRMGAFLMFLKGFRPFKTALTGCYIMLSDWLIQQLGIEESTNKRRFATGILGGFGSMMIALCMTENIYKICRKAVNFFKSIKER